MYFQMPVKSAHIHLHKKNQKNLKDNFIAFKKNCLVT